MRYILFYFVFCCTHCRVYLSKTYGGDCRECDLSNYIFYQMYLGTAAQCRDVSDYMKKYVSPILVTLNSL